MSKIQRLGVSHRWSDVVIHRGVARWVEVPSITSLDARGQIVLVLAQVEATLNQIGSDRTQLLQVIIYLADLADAAILNAHWDEWVADGAPPVRACVQAGLSPGLLLEMVITAAVPDDVVESGVM